MVKILSKAIKENDKAWSREYLNLIDTHYEYLLEDAVEVEVPPFMADVYTGDLFGYLRENQVDDIMFFPIMVINNLTNQQKFDSSVTKLKIPKEDKVSRIIATMT